MILPEAIRRVAEFVSVTPGVLEEAWEPFRHWLAFYGIADDPGESEDQRSDWCNLVVASFCDRFEFANSLKSLRNRVADE